ncbi:MAG: phosphatase PAP2 family protein [Phycisphaerales bacterium]|nr:phosphatase PAP2 family protein [Phycisphaerales bacterium]
MRSRPGAKAVVLMAILVAGFVVLTAADGWVYRLVGPSLDSRRGLESRAWYILLRNVGSLWLWLLVGAVIAGADARRGLSRPRWVRGAFVAASAALAGGGAELLKLIIARERPATIQHVEGGVDALVYQGYHFRGLFAGFADGSNLGMPSSHAATAAGGAFALLWLCPRAGMPAVVLALGCGITRVLAGAHFATDVYAGIVLGWIAAWTLGRVFRVRRCGEPVS